MVRSGRYNRLRVHVSQSQKTFGQWQSHRIEKSEVYLKFSHTYSVNVNVNLEWVPKARNFTETYDDR